MGTTPPRTAASPPPNGGNCIIRGATRRRHAASQLLMVQNPLASRSADFRKIPPHREDSTRSEGVESSRSGVGLAITRTFMNVEEACLPDCGTRGRRQHRRQPNFARNLTWSFFEMPQKRCNSDDANSIFEPVGAELRAKLLIDSHRWTMRRRTQPHISIKAPLAWRAPEGPKGQAR